MILLVEDVPEMAAVFAKALVGSGYTVEVATTGLDAVDAILTGKYALALIDLGLPGIDGEEVARRVIAAGCTTPMVAVSGAVALDEVDVLDASGFKAWVGKPFRVSALLDIVSRYAAPAANE